MRPALKIVQQSEIVTLPTVPWWQQRWVMLTGQVLWWIITYVWWLAVALVTVTLAIISVVMFAMGIMAHFVKSSR
jgi:hypothetical protein